MRSEDHVQLSSWLVHCDRIDSAVDTETEGKVNITKGVTIYVLLKILIVVLQ